MEPDIAQTDSTIGPFARLPWEGMGVAPPGPAWRRLFAELQNVDASGQIDRRLLAALLAAVPADEPWIDAAAAFSERGYRRNQVCSGPGFEALLMCWRSGQRSPIHDHAGSLCGMRVLRGTATETRYDRTETGELVVVGRSRFQAGSVCVSFDTDTHEIANDQSGDVDLLTMHLYLPPLKSMHSIARNDPLARFAHAGATEVLEGGGI